MTDNQEPATCNLQPLLDQMRLRIVRKVWGAIDDVVDQAVFASFFGRHETVAVGVFLEPLERLAGVLAGRSR